MSSSSMDPNVFNHPEEFPVSDRTSRNEIEDPTFDQQSGEKSFRSLNMVMFQGAFSDNVFKLVLTFLALDVAATMASTPEAAVALGSQFQMWVGVAFALPWILSAGFAGWLSTRFSMTRVTQWTKIMEIVVMFLAIIAFAATGERAVLLGIGVMFLMSLQSALFSPSKYGILPKMMGEERVGYANGVLQGFTFLSIVLGTLSAPWLYGTMKDDLGGSVWFIGVILMVLAAVGYGLSRLIRMELPDEAQAPLTAGTFVQVLNRTGDIMRSQGLRWAVTGVFVWSLVAVMIQSAAPLLVKTVLQVPDKWASLALLPIALMMGVGCFIAARFSRNHVELGLIPVGSVGMLIVSMMIAILSPTATAVEEMDLAARLPYQVFIPLLMGGVALFAGMVIVPLQSYILQESEKEERAGIWATASFYTAFSWVLAAVLYGVLVKAFDGPAMVFLISALIMTAMALIMTWRFPRIPLRVLVVLFFYTFYRVKAKGLKNVPRTGGALIAPNHQSYLDGLIIAAVTNRPVRFVMSKKMYSRWYIYPFARATNSIPIESDQSPRELITALRAARQIVDDGGVVCLFPEGAITRNGQLLPFRRGIERVMHGSPCPIIPVAIDGAYDSAFSRREGRVAFFERLRFLPRKSLHVVFGHAQPSNVPAPQLRHSVEGLLSEGFNMRKADQAPLHVAAIRGLRKRVFKRDFSDHTTESTVPNLRVLMGVSILGHRLSPYWEKENFVGILLPPTIGAVVVNVAATTAGKVPVNLNYTASKSILEEICQRTGIDLIITARAFVEKANLDLSGFENVVYLEDIRENITLSEKVRGFLEGFLMPIKKLERSLGRKKPASMDDLATLIFSSGSTGVPKGVMLSHWNITANIWGTLQVVAVQENARFAGLLPFFHSFGYMATLWLPMLRGIGVSYYPNPLDGRAVGDMVEQYQATHMFATPTFCAGYMRRVEPGKFGSLTFLLTGAEKLRIKLADMFEKRFGIRPREGFGCTECSPAVTINGSDFRGPGVYQPGGRDGTVGRPIAGVTLRIDKLNGEGVAAPGEEGMLFVKGPNVMQGYHGMEDKTREVLTDGWYKTGDIASIDEDGFLTITGRLSRFSKLAGEMVPHGRIEEELQLLANADVPVYAVTALPDEKRGEKLIVLHTLPVEEAKRHSTQLSAEGKLPALWLPRWNDYHKVEAIPMLGSGKLDLQSLNKLAESLNQEEGK